MRFLKDLFLGKKGLATTFWLWGMFFTILITFGGIAFLITLATISKPLAIASIAFYVGFVYSYSLFINIAIINAAKYNRDRGFWGWIATNTSSLEYYKRSN